MLIIYYSNNLDLFLFISGWLWDVAGYYLEEGEEPKAQSVMSKTRQTSGQKQATKQQQQQQHILQNTIHSIKQTLVEKKTVENSSQQSEEVSIVNQQLNDVQQSLNPNRSTRLHLPRRQQL